MSNESNRESNRGGDRASHEQHVKGGQQSHKNEGSPPSKNASSDSERGGSHEQHVKAGQESHKNR